jgi:hypothetical protein
MRLYKNNASHKNTKLFHWPSVFENYKILKNTRDKNQQSCDVALKKLVTPGEVSRFYSINPIGVPLKYLAIFCYTMPLCDLENRHFSVIN